LSAAIIVGVEAETQDELNIAKGLLFGCMGLLAAGMFASGLLTTQNHPEPVEATNQEPVCPSF